MKRRERRMAREVAASLSAVELSRAAVTVRELTAAMLAATERRARR